MPLSIHALAAAALLVGVLGVAQGLPQWAASGGRTLAFAWLVGAALGLVLQRARFCFYCHARDWFEGRDPRGLLSIVLALGIGVVATTAVLGAWVPDPRAGSLPPDMHIGPVSGVLVLAGLAFGLGMVVSGSCISAHWYRLAEGSAVAPFALLGTALGFILGFKSWNALYSWSVADAPVVWLPAHLGYGGALLLQGSVLLAVAAWLWRGFARQGGQMPAEPAASAVSARVDSPGAGVPPLGAAWARLWQGRWPYWLGGLAVGVIGALVIVRMRPLGVTATLGSAARSWAQGLGWIPDPLNGLNPTQPAVCAALAHVAGCIARRGRRCAAGLGRDDGPGLHHRHLAVGQHGGGPVGVGFRRSGLCRRGAGACREAPAAAVIDSSLSGLRSNGYGRMQLSKA